MADTLRAKALALLSRREYSRVALAKKLAPLAEPEAALEALLDDLVARNLLSDTRYAASRANRRGERYGNARIAYELLREGVPSEEAETALMHISDEFERCRVVWQKKFGAQPDSLAERARQARFLHYRGFSSDNIRQVLGGIPETDDAF